MESIDRETALQAIPVAQAIQDRFPLEDGGVRLTVAVPTRPMQQKFLRLPPMTTKDFDLDAFGNQILQWCDGKNSVGDILNLFNKEYQLHPHEAEKSLLSFIRTLVRKGVLTLVVKKK